MVRSRSFAAASARRILAGLVCALVLIAVAALLQRATLSGHQNEHRQIAAGVCGEPADDNPVNDACWHAPQPVNVLTATSGWQCPDADAGCDWSLGHAPYTSIDTQTLPVAPTTHREIHRRSIPLLI